ncbi:MAG TPA: hypothetical protein VF755_03410 [Catenuloplanes sp.]
MLKTLDPSAPGSPDPPVAATPAAGGRHARPQSPPRGTAPDDPATAQAAPAATVAQHLGAAPWILVLSSLGVVLVAVSYAGSRATLPAMLPVYWVGQVLVFTPVVARLLSRRLAGVAESFLLVVGLAVNQYLLKWMYSPDQFRFPDELQHWAATTLLVDSGELFRPNPALPPAVNFPGLAEMGAAVTSLTGLSVTTAGFLVAGVAHLSFVSLLFMVVRQAGGSPAVAGLSCVVYATALHYLFFDSMYLYQTAALPFLMLGVWAFRTWLRRLASRRGRPAWPYGLLGLIAVLAATMSHHVTAVVLVGTLTLLSAGELLAGGRPRRWITLVPPAASMLVVVLWFAAVADDALAYLRAPVAAMVAAADALLSGQADSVAAPPAAPLPWWQAAVQVVGLVLLLALLAQVAWATFRDRMRDPWRWALLAGAMIFFASNGARFLGAAGPELAGRASTFTYIPMSIVAALALLRPAPRYGRRFAGSLGRLRDRLWGRAGDRAERPRAGLRSAAVAVSRAAGTLVGAGVRTLLSRVAIGALVATVLLVGARVGGWPPSTSLLPGGYLVSGFERSVDGHAVAAARWTAVGLGRGHRMAADLTGVALVSTYGGQDPVREAAPLYYAPEWGLHQDELADLLSVNYLWVDRRMSEQLPASGAYFEMDPLAGRHRTPMSAGALAKFDDLPFMDRLYDNGEVRIYRMGGR